MSTPHMPNIPGAAVMTDTLDFVKNLWGSMGVPGISIPGLATPTLSVDELDKKINELKAVESWLNLNATMLRSSIQALEVQRGTIAALKSMGQSLAAAVQQSSGEHSMFAQMAAKPGNGTASEPKAAPAADKAAADKPAAKPADPASAAAAQMVNPAAWWNMLQDQFTQAVSTAMAAEPRKPQAAATASPAPTPAPAPASATTAATAATAPATKSAPKPAAVSKDSASVPARKPATKKAAKP